VTDPLVAAAQAGDRRALDQLLRREQPRIHTLCRRMTGNDTDALDAAQDALIAIVRGLPRYDGRAAFSTWAYRVATNACLDELRRRKRRPVPVDDTALSTRPSAAADVGEQVTQRSALDDALATLSPEFRAPLVLRDVLGLDYHAIAETLEIPPGTVRSRIARARGQLADLLAEREPERPVASSEEDRSGTTP
jgi:RNA polymerase sigma-70 factor (ECF subfamily)